MVLFLKRVIAFANFIFSRTIKGLHYSFILFGSEEGIKGEQGHNFEVGRSELQYRKSMLKSSKMGISLLHNQLGKSSGTFNNSQHTIHF